MAALCLNCFRIPTDVFILSDAVFPGGEAPFSAYICRPECLHRSAELYFLPFVFGVDGLLFAVDGSFIERGRCPVEYVVGTFRRSGNLSGGTDGLGLAAGKAYRQGGPSSMDGPKNRLCFIWPEQTFWPLRQPLPRPARPGLLPPWHAFPRPSCSGGCAPGSRLPEHSRPHRPYPQ